MRLTSMLLVVGLQIAASAIQAQVPSLTPAEVLSAVARQRAAASGASNTVVVLPLTTCWQVLLGDPACTDEMPSSRFHALANERADQFAAALGADRIATLEFVARWQAQRAPTAVSTSCSEATATLTVATPISVVMDEQTGESIARIHSATWPQGAGCSGSAIVAEYRVSRDEAGRAVVRSAKSLVHFSGLRPPP
jgi:hypothetical protein